MRAALALFLLLGFSAATANDDEQLIEALLVAVGDSECTFIRNGKEHAAEDAEAHLRMKYRRGKRHVSSVETFIRRIATKSSMSGKLYRIRCGDAEAVPSADWLNQRLEEIRSRESQPDVAFHSRS